jgi:hypothetical protein
VNRIAPFEHFLEHDGCADRVDGRVALDLVHGLTDADGGGEVDDGVDAVERVANRVVVANVAVDELDVLGEVGRSRGVRMHLRIEAVERAHAMAFGKEAIGEMGADEAGAACDQDVHRGVRLPDARSGERAQRAPSHAGSRRPGRSRRAARARS